MLQTTSFCSFRECFQKKCNTAGRLVIEIQRNKKNVAYLISGFRRRLLLTA